MHNAGAALSRSRTAPPSTLLRLAESDAASPTFLSTLAGTAYLEDLSGDPSSPASTATGIPGVPGQGQGQGQVSQTLSLGWEQGHGEALSSQSAPPLFSLGKRRLSDSAIGLQQSSGKRPHRPHLAHVEAAIQQVGKQGPWSWLLCLLQHSWLKWEWLW